MKLDLFVVKDVVSKESGTRADNFNIIGRTCSIYTGHIEEGRSMMIFFDDYPLTTSRVQEFEFADTILTVITLNTIYTFERITTE